MSTSARFWDRMAERYSRKPIADEETYQKKLRKIRDYLKSDMAMLEFGCGTGSTAISLAPHVKHIHVSDISAKMIEIARRKTAETGVKNVSFEQSTIEALDIPDQSVDLVLAMSVLHLLDDPADVVARVHKMLKPGGVMVSSTMCLADSMKWFKYVGPIASFFGVLPTVKIFSRSALDGYLHNVGFEIDYDWQPGKNKSAFIVAKKAL